jgi:hypothetical protein
MFEPGMATASMSSSAKADDPVFREAGVINNPSYYWMPRHWVARSSPVKPGDDSFA